MADKTDFLELTLPENGEFYDQWESPVNNNFETIDDNAKDTKEKLVGSSGTMTQLKGSKNSLLERLAVSLSDDGTLDMSNTEEFTDLKYSQVYALSSSSDLTKQILDRLHEMEKELISLRAGDNKDRYLSSASDAIGTMALLAGSYGGAVPPVDGLKSPVRGFSPNCPVDGPLSGSVPTHLVEDGTTAFYINGTGDGVLYNIDGLPFRVKGTLTLDFSALATSGDLVGNSTYPHFIFVSRNESDYNTAASPKWAYSKYNGVSLGGSYKLDPRIVPCHADLRADADSATDPTDGQVTAAGNELTSAGSQFSTYGVEAGDLLVISSPTNLAGKYPVASVSSDTVLTIVGKFRKSSSAVTFHIERPSMPSLGIAYTASTVPTNPSISPNDNRPYTDGRAYVGMVVLDSSGEIVGGSLVPFFYNGVYDSGWLALDGGWEAGLNHYLGEAPSQVDVIVRKNDGTYFYNPLIYYDVQHADVGGAGGGTPTWNYETVGMPALSFGMSYEKITPTPTRPLSTTHGRSTDVFSDSKTTYVVTTDTDWKIRFIARR